MESLCHAEKCWRSLQEDICNSACLGHGDQDGFWQRAFSEQCLVKCKRGKQTRPSRQNRAPESKSYSASTFEGACEQASSRVGREMGEATGWKGGLEADYLKRIQLFSRNRVVTRLMGPDRIVIGSGAQSPLALAKSSLPSICFMWASSFSQLHVRSL